MRRRIPTVLWRRGSKIMPRAAAVVRSLAAAGVLIAAACAEAPVRELPPIMLAPEGIPLVPAPGAQEAPTASSATVTNEPAVSSTQTAQAPLAEATPSAGPENPAQAQSTQPVDREEDALGLVGQSGERLRQEDYAGSMALLQRATAAAPRLLQLEPGQRLRRLEGLLSDLDWSANVARQIALTHPSGAADLAAKEAISAFIEGRDVEAVLLASAAVGENPQAEGTRLLLASIARRTGLEAPREEQVPRAALVQFKLQRAERAILDKRYGEAARDCQEAVWLDPKNALAWTRLGSSRWASGEPEKARQAFEEALALDPKNMEVASFIESKGLHGRGRSAAGATAKGGGSPASGPAPK